MKIGIITYHRAYNYGSALQAYALNYLLRSKGYEVKTIDFSPGKQAELYKIFEENKSFMGIARNIQSLIYYNKLKKHKENFDEFIFENIPITNKFSSLKELENEKFDFDYYICGSDQIWNQNCDDFDNAYLLSFVKDKNKCISYAPSIGVSSITEEQKENFKNNISSFKSISIREIEGAKILEKVLNREIEVVLDPTFLISEEEWRKLSQKPKLKGKYIFGYFIGDVSGMRNFANKIRKKSNLPLVVVYKNLRDMKFPTKKCYESGPKEFLGLIQNASYVCTNYFHAVAFSVIFKKKFWVFVEENKNGINKPQTRIRSICKILNLSERILTNKSCSNINIQEEIDFEDVYQLLEIYKNKSLEFLFNNLQ